MILLLMLFFAAAIIYYHKNAEGIPKFFPGYLLRIILSFFIV